MSPLAPVEAGRLERIRVALREAGHDVGVFGDRATLQYLTGIRIASDERLVALIVPATAAATLVAPALNAEHIGLGTALHTIGYTDNDGPLGALRSAFASLVPLRSPSIDKDHLTVRQAEQIMDAAGFTTCGDATMLMDALRMHKSAAELQLMRASARIASRCVDALASLLRPGMTELELADRLRALALAEGADAMAFDPSVLFGARTASPHGQPGRVRLRPDDVILVDFGVVSAGYASDMTRMFTVGTPPDGLAALYAVVHCAHAAGLAAARPGATCDDVDRAARTVVADAGHGERFNHVTGHGIGIVVHEAPRVAAGHLDLLREGTVVTIEPGIYLPERYGVRLEDTVVVTSGKALPLTTTGRELTPCAL